MTTSRKFCMTLPVGLLSKFDSRWRGWGFHSRQSAIVAVLESFMEDIESQERIKDYTAQIEDMKRNREAFKQSLKEELREEIRAEVQKAIENAKKETV